MMIEAGKKIRWSMSSPASVKLKKAIAAYLFRCSVQSAAPTLEGLALSLGTRRRTLASHYRRDEFLDAIKRARQNVEEYFETFPAGRPVASVDGIVADLDQDQDWRDGQREERVGISGGPARFAFETSSTGDGRTRQEGAA